MSRHPKNVFPSTAATAAVIALFAGSLAGCGSMTSAPLSSEGASAMGGVSTHVAGGSVAPVDDPSAGETPTAPSDVVIDVTEVLEPFTPDAGQDGPIVRGIDMNGAVGGTLGSGRWTLEMPANAFEGTARVELATPSSKSWGCELNIYPAEKNGFATPVRLSVDCHNIPTSRLENYVILWFNPATFEWEPVEGSTVDVRGKTVSAPLTHFSIYALGTTEGRGGW